MRRAKFTGNYNTVFVNCLRIVTSQQDCEKLLRQVWETLDTLYSAVGLTVTEYASIKQ